MDQDTLVSTGTRVRVAVAVIVVLINVLADRSMQVLPWALLVLGLDVVAGAAGLSPAPLRPVDRQAVTITATLAGAAAAGLSVTGGPGALPLILVPLLRAGQAWGRRGVSVGLFVFLLLAVTGWLRGEPPANDLPLATTMPWLALTGALGFLGAIVVRASSPVAQAGREGAPADEAAWLMSRLEGLATELKAGFDPATSAEHLLDALPKHGLMPRSGVLIGAPSGRAVPLALRGSLRVPWADPRQDEGVLGDAWYHARAGVATLANGRLLIAVPLRDTHGGPFGVAVIDCLPGNGTSAQLLNDTTAIVRQHEGLVAVALAFAGLRERAGIEERERLARTIHDGIAQELVALGFRVDRLKRLPDHEMRPEAVRLRAELSRVLADVRSHIGDLRLTVRPEGGLGAAITSQLQVFGAASGANVTLRLAESAFRLPAHVETGLYRIFLDFLGDARRSGATELDVAVRTQAPDAHLVLRQSGNTRLTVTDLLSHLPASLGGDVDISTSAVSTQIMVHLTAVPDPAPVLDERLPQPS